MLYEVITVPIRSPISSSIIGSLLTVNEIFYSIQGESSYAGRPCVFVRLTACDLRCSWCDTAYAFHEGSKRTTEDVLREVESFGCSLVEVTGGRITSYNVCYTKLLRMTRGSCSM